MARATQRPALTLFLALLISGCNLPALLTPTPGVRVVPNGDPPPTLTHTPVPPTATPGPPPDPIQSRLDRIDAARMMADVEALAAIPSRHVNSPGASEAAELIASGFQEAGLEVQAQDFPLTYEEVFTTQRNVIGLIPGSDPDAGTIVIGAHYDSRTVGLLDVTSPAPGANDNATGVAVLLELARALKDSAPRRTLLLIAFAAEETGSQGSRQTVIRFRADGRDVRAVVVFDIVGNSAGEAGAGSIRAFAAPPLESPSQALARYAALVGADYVSAFDVAVQPDVDRPGRYSDHVPFSDSGIPAMRFIEAIEDLNRQHSGDDLPEFIDADYLGRVGRLALALSFSLANSVDSPTGLAIEEETLHWEPIPGAVSYVVAFREPEGVEVASTFTVDLPSLTWEGFSDGRDGWVSVAGVGERGVVGMFSAEIQLSGE